MQRRHHLAIRIKRVLRNARILRTQGQLILAEVVGQIDERQFRRIADALSAGTLRVVTQYEAQFQQLIDAGRSQFFCVQLLIVSEKLLSAHAILGQRSGLIRTDNVYTAYSFARHHLLNQSVLLRHFDDIYRKRDRDDSRHTLRHCRDDQDY